MSNQKWNPNQPRGSDGRFSSFQNRGSGQNTRLQYNPPLNRHSRDSRPQNRGYYQTYQDNYQKNDFHQKHSSSQRHSYQDKYSNPPISRYSSSMSKSKNERGSTIHSGNFRDRDSRDFDRDRKRESSNGFIDKKADPWRQNLYNNDQRKNPWFRDNLRRDSSSKNSDFAEPSDSKNKSGDKNKLDIIKKGQQQVFQREQSPNQIIINLSDVQNPKIVEEQSASQPTAKQVKSQGTYSIGKYHSQKSFASQAKRSLKQSQGSEKVLTSIKKKPLLKQIGFNEHNKIINLEEPSPPKATLEMAQTPQKTKRQQAILLKNEQLSFQNKQSEHPVPSQKELNYNPAEVEFEFDIDACDTMQVKETTLQNKKQSKSPALNAKTKDSSQKQSNETYVCRRQKSEEYVKKRDQKERTKQILKSLKDSLPADLPKLQSKDQITKEIRKQTMENITKISGIVDLEIQKQTQNVKRQIKDEYQGGIAKKVTQRMRVQNTYVFHHGKSVSVKNVDDPQAKAIRFTQGDEAMVKSIIEDKYGDYDEILDQVKGQIPNFTGICSWGLQQNTNRVYTENRFKIRTIARGLRSPHLDTILQLSPQQRQNLERLNQILLPIKIQYEDFEPNNMDMLKLLNLSFAFKYDKIKSFIRNRKKAIFNLHRQHKNEYYKKHAAYKRKYNSVFRRRMERLESKHPKQHQQVLDMAPAKIQERLDQAREDSKKEEGQTQDQSQAAKPSYNIWDHYCFVDPNRFNENKAQNLAPNQPQFVAPKSFNPYALMKIYHPHSFELRLIQDMREHELDYFKSQKWTVSQIQLFVQKYLVYKCDFSRICGFFAGRSGDKGVKEVVNLYWLVKKQFKLGKIEKQVNDCAFGRFQLIQRLSQEVVEEWFAKRDGHGQTLAGFEEVENLADVARLLNRKNLGNLKTKAGSPVRPNYFDQQQLNRQKSLNVKKSQNKVRDPNYVDIEQQSGLRILDSAQDISYELDSNMTQPNSPEISASKISQQHIGQQFSMKRQHFLFSLDPKDKCPCPPEILIHAKLPYPAHLYRLKKNSLLQHSKKSAVDPNLPPDYNVLCLKEIQQKATEQEKELQEDLEEELKEKLEAEQRQRERQDAIQDLQRNKNKQSLKSIAYLEDQPSVKNDKKRRKKEKKLEKKMRKERQKSKVLSNSGSQKQGLNRPMVVMNPRNNAFGGGTEGNKSDVDNTYAQGEESSKSNSGSDESSDGAGEIYKSRKMTRRQIDLQNQKDLVEIKNQPQGANDTTYSQNSHSQDKKEKKKSKKNKKSYSSKLMQPPSGCQWTEQDKIEYIKYLKKYGREWEKIQKKLPSKTVPQCKNFFMNNLKKMKLYQYLDKNDSYFNKRGHWTSRQNSSAATGQNSGDKRESTKNRLSQRGSNSQKDDQKIQQDFNSNQPILSKRKRVDTTNQQPSVQIDDELLKRVKEISEQVTERENQQRTSQQQRDQYQAKLNSIFNESDHRDSKGQSRPGSFIKNIGKPKNQFKLPESESNKQHEITTSVQKIKEETESYLGGEPSETSSKQKIKIEEDGLSIVAQKSDYIPQNFKGGSSQISGQSERGLDFGSGRSKGSSSE